MMGYLAGEMANCKQCGRPIQYNGVEWSHYPVQFRHNPEPMEDNDAEDNAAEANDEPRAGSAS